MANGFTPMKLIHLLPNSLRTRFVLGVATTLLPLVLLRAAMPPNDHFIHADPAERDNFSRFGMEVEQL